LRQLCIHSVSVEADPPAPTSWRALKLLPGGGGRRGRNQQRGGGGGEDGEKGKTGERGEDRSWEFYLKDRE